MSDHSFEPPPIPLNSKILVATLKRRLQEAIETGKASDAKVFLDTYERLAKMDWLDEISPQDRRKINAVKRQRLMADVDQRLARYLSAQRAEMKANKQDL